MITHIVLFKLKEPTDANLREAADRLRALDGEVPELVSIDVGIDQLRSERSFDLALRTTHRTWADLDAYQVNPLHEAVKAYLKGVAERSVAVDYES